MSDTATVSQKWRNVSAGPRQVKDANRAISALRSEGTAHDEITGVIGGEEHSWSYMSLMSPPRAEVAALDEAIRAKYGHEITRENVRAIIADYEAALPEARKSRPVEDNRRSADEEAKRNAVAAERATAEKAERDARDAVLNAVMAKAPAGVKALIVAEYRVDASDPMTDYFASRTQRTVAIGWRHSSREDFRALHAAAAQFTETAGVEFTEHRDNHSMGAGNYLSDHGWAGAGSGWLIKSADLPCKWVHVTEDALPERSAATEGGNGFYDQRGNWIPQADSSGGAVTVSPSSLGREGVVEIRFAERPADDVITGLKAHGFRWARGNRCWYGSDTAYANALATA